MKKRPSLLFCYGSIAVGLFLGSLMAPLLRFTLARHWGLRVENILFYRMLFASLFLWTFCLLSKNTRSHIKRIFADRRTLVFLSVIGLSRAAELLLWSVALRDTNVFVVNILGNSTPVFILLGTYLVYRQKTSSRALIGIAVCMGGLCLTGLSGGAGGASLESVLQMTGTAVLQTVFLLLSQPLRSGDEPLPATLMMAFVFSIAAVCSLGLCAVRSVPIAPFPWQGWGMLVAMTLLCTIYHQTVPTWTLQFLKPENVSMLNLAGPVVAAVTAFFLLGEVPNLQTICGGIIVLTGLGWYIRQDAKAKRAQMSCPPQDQQ